MRPLSILLLVLCCCCCCILFSIMTEARKGLYVPCQKNGKAEVCYTQGGPTWITGTCDLLGADAGGCMCEEKGYRPKAIPLKSKDGKSSKNMCCCARCVLALSLSLVSLSPRGLLTFFFCGFTQHAKLALAQKSCKTAEASAHSKRTGIWRCVRQIMNVFLALDPYNFFSFLHRFIAQEVCYIHCNDASMLCVQQCGQY